MMFSKVVNASSLALSSLLAEKSNTSHFELPLEESVLLSTNSRIIELSVANEKMNQFKLNGIMLNANASKICTSKNSTVVYDMYRNSLTDISCDHPLSVEVYVPDTTPPQLVNFSLSLNNSVAVIIATFDEPIQLWSIFFGGITLIAPSTGASVTLTGGSISNNTGVSLQANVILTPEDTDALKIQQICLVQENCIMSLKSAAVYDTSNNAILPTTQAVGSFLGDHIPPSIVAVDLDMDQGNVVCSNVTYHLIPFKNNNTLC